MNLTDDQRIQASARVLEKFGFLEGLLANPDFEKWQEIGPKAQLKELQERILSIKRESDWKEKVCELVIAYQSIETAMIASTTDNETAVRIAREHMKQFGVS